MEIGDRLKKARAEKGFTQEQIAEELGVSRQSISHWENNRSYPDIVSVIKLSDLYSVSLDELLKEDKNMLRHLAETTEAANKRIKVSKWFLAGVYTTIWVLFIPLFWLLVISPDEFTFGLRQTVYSADVMFRLFYPLCTGIIAVIIGIRGYYGKLKWLYIPVNGIAFAMSYCSTWSLWWYLLLLDEPDAQFVFLDYIREFFIAESYDVATGYPLTGIIAAALGLFIGSFIRYYRIVKAKQADDKAF